MTFRWWFLVPMAALGPAVALPISLKNRAVMQSPPSPPTSLQFFGLGYGPISLSGVFQPADEYIATGLPTPDPDGWFVIPGFPVPASFSVNETSFLSAIGSGQILLLPVQARACSLALEIGADGTAFPVVTGDGTCERTRIRTEAGGAFVSKLFAFQPMTDPTNGARILPRPFTSSLIMEFPDPDRDGISSLMTIYINVPDADPSAQLVAEVRPDGTSRLFVGSTN